MLVLDASAVAEMLFPSAAGQAISELALTGNRSLHAPHLLAAEVAQVVRRYRQGRSRTT